MGHNAYAHLVVGVDLGSPYEDDELPEWLAKLGADPPTAVDKALGNTFGTPGQVEMHSYGYHDLPHFILGIKVASAIDYSSTRIDAEKLAYDLPATRSMVRSALRRLGAPSDVEIGVYVCPGS